MGKSNKTNTDKRLGFKLAVIVGCKVALITAIFFAFFGPETKTDQSPEAVSARLLSSPSIISEQGQK